MDAILVRHMDSRTSLALIATCNKVLFWAIANIRNKDWVAATGNSITTSHSQPTNIAIQQRQDMSHIDMKQVGLCPV